MGILSLPLLIRVRQGFKSANRDEANSNRLGSPELRRGAGAQPRLSGAERSGLPVQRVFRFPPILAFKSYRITQRSPEAAVNSGANSRA
jgi:hypothetical protein